MGVGWDAQGKRCHLQGWLFLATRCMFQSATKTGQGPDLDDGEG